MGDELRSDSTCSPAPPLARRAAKCSLEKPGELGPRALAAAPLHRVAAVGIVEREHARLVHRTAGAEAVGVARVAVDLDRTAVVAGDVQADRATVDLHRRRELFWHAGGRPLWPPRKRHELVLVPAAAGTGQPERGAHQLHEPAPLRRVRRHVFERGGELTLDELAELRRVLELGQAAPVERLELLQR